MGILCSSESPVEFSYPEPDYYGNSYPQPRPGFVSVDILETRDEFDKSFRPTSTNILVYSCLLITFSYIYNNLFI